MPVGAPRIFIAEDEALIAITLEDCVRQLGYETVGPFYSLNAALAAARNADVHAAIIDIKFGDALSYELAELLAARNIPFAFATGVMARGVDPKWADRPYLSKPYDVRDVERLLSELLPRSRLA